MSKMSELPSCLAGAGLLGHTWLVTQFMQSGERLACQTSRGSDAARVADELGGTCRIWTKGGPRGWKEIPRRAAVMD